jgi:hypothetical protein
MDSFWNFTQESCNDFVPACFEIFGSTQGECKIGIDYGVEKRVGVCRWQ